MTRRLPTLFLTLVLLAGLRAIPASAAPADPSDPAWATLRARVPASQPLYRPTWLPDRFRSPGVVLFSGPIDNGVGYRSDRGELLVFTYQQMTYCEPHETPQAEPVLIHGNLGKLLAPGPSCPNERLRATWTVHDQPYSIMAVVSIPNSATLTREEMLHVIAGLALVGPGGATVSLPPGSATPESACFAETKHCLAGPFLAYWQANGGLARNGYPLTGEMLERLEDGTIYQVQYFERVRLEYHPTNTPPYDILLGQFGRRIHGQVDPPAAQLPNATYYRETGHNLGGSFRDYWEANGGRAQFGYPITEEIRETLEDGRQYRVQYFERARFEHHPENTGPYDILLGQFGRRILTNAR